MRAFLLAPFVRLVPTLAGGAVFRGAWNQTGLRIGDGTSVAMVGNAVLRVSRLPTADWSVVDLASPLPIAASAFAAAAVVAVAGSTKRARAESTQEAGGKRPTTSAENEAT